MEEVKTAQEVNGLLTRELVTSLCNDNISRKEYAELCLKAEKMISAFEKKGSVRNDGDIAAIIHLAHIPDKNIFSYIMASFGRLACDEGAPPRLKVRLFVAMADAHRIAVEAGIKNQINLNQSDLIDNLRLITKTMMLVHKKDPDISYLLMMLRAFCRFSDSLFDAGVSDLNKELLKNPAYNLITSLTTHNDPEIQFLANYAQQGLVRVSSNEPTSLRNLRRVRDLAKGLAALSDIAFTLTSAIMSGGVAIARVGSIPNNALNILDACKSMLHLKKPKEAWYMQLRLLDVVFGEIISSPNLDDDTEQFNQAFNAEFLETNPTIEFCEGFVYRLEEWLRRDPSAKSKVFFQQIVKKLFIVALNNDGSVWMMGRLSKLVNVVPYVNEMTLELHLCYDVISQTSNPDFSDTVLLLKTILALAIIDPESVNDDGLKVLQQIYMKLGIQAFDKKNRLIVKSTTFQVLRYLLMYIPEGDLSNKIQSLITQLANLPVKRTKRDKEGVSKKRNKLLNMYVVKSQPITEFNFVDISDELFNETNMTFSGNEQDLSNKSSNDISEHKNNPRDPRYGLDVKRLSTALIQEISQNYRKKHSDLTPVLHSEKGTPILNAFVNLALVQEVANDNKEAKSSRVDNRYLNSYEQIYGKKTEIGIPDLFKIREEEAKVSHQFTSPSRLLVEGWAGIGKSVFCQYISNLWAIEAENGKVTLWDGQFEMILWIPLRNLSTYTQRAYTLADVVKAECLPNDSNISVDDIADVLTLLGNRVLLVLDGYDEAASWYFETNPAHQHPKHWSYRCQLLRALIDQHTYPTIMTSRPRFVDSDLRQRFDRRLETIGFKDEDIDKYITIYFHTNNQDNRGKELLSEMQTQPILREAAYVPVNLSLICLIWKNASEKEKRSEQLTLTRLYSEIVVYLLRRDYCERLKRDGKLKDDGTREVLSAENATKESQAWKINHFENDAEYGVMLQWLEEIAWKNQCGSKEHNILIPGKTLIAFLDEKGTHPNKIIDKIKWLKRLGLLNERYTEKSIEENDYFFPHLTFQEYFAAQYWVRQYLHEKSKPQAEENLYLYKFDRRFDVVWRFTSGLIDIYQPGNIQNYLTTLLMQPHEVTGLSEIVLLINSLSEANGRLTFIESDRKIKSLLQRFLNVWIHWDPEYLVPDVYMHACSKLITFYDTALLNSFSSNILFDEPISLEELYRFAWHLPRLSEKLLDECLINLYRLDAKLHGIGLYTLLKASDNAWNEQRIDQLYKFAYILISTESSAGVHLLGEHHTWFLSKIDDMKKNQWLNEIMNLTQSEKYWQVFFGIDLINSLPLNELSDAQRARLFPMLFSNKTICHIGDDVTIRNIAKLRINQKLPVNYAPDFDIYQRALNNLTALPEVIDILCKCPWEELPSELRITALQKIKNLDIHDLLTISKHSLLLSPSNPIKDSILDSLSYFDKNSDPLFLAWVCRLPDELPYFQPRSGYCDRLILAIVNLNESSKKMDHIRWSIDIIISKFSILQKDRMMKLIETEVINNTNDIIYKLLCYNPHSKFDFNPNFLKMLWTQVCVNLERISPNHLGPILMIFNPHMDKFTESWIKDKLLLQLREEINDSRIYDHEYRISPWICRLPLDKLTTEERIKFLAILYVLSQIIPIKLDNLFGDQAFKLFIHDTPSPILCEMLYLFATGWHLFIRSNTGYFIVDRNTGESTRLRDCFTKFFNRLRYTLREKAWFPEFDPLEIGLESLDSIQTLGQFKQKPSNSPSRSSDRNQDPKQNEKQGYSQ